MTLTVIALPTCVLTTLAYFDNQHVLLAQLSPFRVQYAGMLVAHALLCLVLRRRRWALLFALFAAFNLWAVIRPSVPARHPPVATVASHPPIKLLLANVLSSNSDSRPLLDLIATEQPDVIALLEINERWRAQLSPALAGDYPHAIHRPREDNFGLALFSRVEPTEERFELFVDGDIPSLACTLPLGPVAIRLLLTHPLPPGAAMSTRLRDRQLVEITKWARDTRAPAPDLTPPAIVILGDLNATPWCPPLRALLAHGNLRLASAGHEVFPATWPTTVPWLRIPLDHALLDDSLVCTRWRIGPSIGSDHFPIILEILPAAASRHQR